MAAANDGYGFDEEPEDGTSALHELKRATATAATVANAYSKLMLEILAGGWFNLKRPHRGVTS